VAVEQVQWDLALHHRQRQPPVALEVQVLHWILAVHAQLMLVVVADVHITEADQQRGSVVLVVGARLT
jgi:hypothetical protein